jgi:excisionase family DNA binding protein
MASNGNLLSTGQAARLLSVTPDTVLKWIKQGRVPAAQTAGGHYRIAREHIEHLVKAQDLPVYASPPPGLVYCWEYYSATGEINPQCEECVVYKARALHCYEMSDLPPEAGFAGTYCKTSCEECSYYRELIARPKRVLIVTDSVRLRERLQREKQSARVQFEFASCEYECSAIVHSFKPEYVVIDCSLPDDACADLCSHLATDPRIPGVQIILTNGDNDGSSIPGIEEGLDGVAQLSRFFTVAELEHHIAGPSRPAKEVKQKNIEG